MRSSASIIRSSFPLHRTIKRIFLALVVSALGMAFSVTASAQVTANFEDGGLDGWSTFGGGSPLAVSNSTDVANDGTHSLLVTGRSQTFQGPGINLTSTLTGGQTYVFKIAVRLSCHTPGSDNGNMTMRNIVN